MARAKGFNVRIPGDVLSAAKARAASEHRSLADVIVRFLREYGQMRAGVPNEVPVPPAGGGQRIVSSAPASLPSRPEPPAAPEPAGPERAPARRTARPAAKAPVRRAAEPEGAGDIMAVLRRKRAEREAGQS